MNCSSSAPRSIDQCSGNGILCLQPNQLCICDTSWSDVGDFAIIKGLNCEIHILAVKILCILSLIAASYSFSIILRYLVKRCYKQRTVCIFTTKSNTLFPLFFLLYDVTIIFFVSLKFAGYIIGRDLLITVLLPFQGSFLFSGLVLYYFVVINFLKLNVIEIPISVMGKIEKKLTDLSLYVWAMPPLSMIFYILPLFGLLFPGHQIIFWQSFFIGTGITSIMFSILIRFACEAFLTEISSHIKSVEGTNYESEDIQMICKRMKRLRTRASPIGLLIGLLTISFGCSEALLRVSTYLILLAQIQVPLLLVMILSSFFQTELNPVRIHLTLSPSANMSRASPGGGSIALI